LNIVWRCCIQTAKLRFKEEKVCSFFGSANIKNAVFVLV